MEAGADEPAQPPAERAETDARPTIEARGMVQVRYHLVDDQDLDASVLSSEDQSTFFLRRARVQASFRPDERILLTLEGELSTPDEPVRDAYARYRFAKALEVTAGNLKRPFGATELDGAWEILTAERGLVSSRLRDLELSGRDIGFLLSGRFKRLAGLRYAAGLFNGDGGGLSGEGLSKLVPGAAARLSVSPGPLTVGAAVSWNGKEVDTVVTPAGWAVEGDATLDSRWLFARVEGFLGKNRRAVYGQYDHYAGALAILTARIRVPAICTTFEPGFKAELLDTSTSQKNDELLLLTPLVRVHLGEHFVLHLEGNVLLREAFDAARPEEGGVRLEDQVPQETFLVQLGARV
ncbi:MAG: hypothetical protein HYY06_29325 [Deltaproteobacteria bacterium]|nr:hypothetical protein [Deltaproteobacteria bacterium]